MLIVNNNHFPTPLNPRHEPALCVHCEQYVEYIDDIGWIHSSRDHRIYRQIGEFVDNRYGDIWVQLTENHATVYGPEQ